MKILRVAGNNLASLPKFDIDFRKFLGNKNEVFAIIGDTGAGKSTILDAICLGLYGTTPRTDVKKTGNISLDDNTSVDLQDTINIMTRGEKSCSATVDFIGKDGQIYRSCYEIRKKTKKFTKQLTLQLLNDSGNSVSTIATSTNKDCTKLVVNCTGLTWQQFRKVIILPQGDFSAFLDEESDKKTELLQKLTGTEIYQEIDKLATERFKKIKALIDKEKEKKADLESKLLSDEDITSKNLKISQKSEEFNAINNKINNYNNYQEKFKDLKNKKKALHESEQKSDRLKNNINNLKDEERTVNLWNLVSPFRELNNDLKHNEKIEKNTSDERNELIEETNKLEKKVEADLKEYNNCNEIKTKRIEEKEAKKQNLDIASEYESRSSELQSDIKNLQNNIDSKKEEITLFQKDLSKYEDEKTDIEKRKTALEEEHNKDQKYQTLPPLWDEFRSGLTNYRNEKAHLNRLNNNKNNLNNSIKDCEDNGKKFLQKYKELTLDESPYSVENSLPNSIPVCTTLDTLKSWHELDPALKNSVSALKSNVKDFLYNAQTFPEEYKKCQSSHDFLKKIETQYIDWRNKYENEKPNIEQAEILERKISDINNEIAGITGQCNSDIEKIKNLKNQITNLEDEIKVLKAKESELNTNRENDQKWNSLAARWNDIHICVAKFRLFDRSIVEKENEIAAKDDELKQKQKTWKETIKKYKNLVLEDSEKNILISDSELDIPASVVYTNAAKTIGNIISGAGGIDSVLAETEHGIGNFADMSEKFFNACNQFFSNTEELSRLQGDDSPLSSLDNRIKELESNIRNSQAAEKLKEISLSLKQGDACPCCGSTLHPALDNLNTELSVHLETLRKNLSKYNEELNETKEKREKLNNRKQQLQANLDINSSNISEQIINMIKKFVDISKKNDQILKNFNNIDDQNSWSEIPESAIITTILNLLHEIADKGKELPLFKENVMSKFYRCILLLENKLPATGNMNTIISEYTEADSLSILEEIRKIATLTHDFREQILNKTISKISNLNKNLQDIPGVLSKLHETKKEINNLKESIRQLQGKKEKSQNEQKAVVIAGSDSTINEVWHELTNITDENEYNSCIEKYNKTVERICGYESKYSSITREIADKNNEIQDKNKEIIDLNDKLNNNNNEISNKNNKINEFQTEIKKLTLNMNSAQTFRDHFENALRSAKDEYDKADRNFTEILKNVNQIQKNMANKYNDISIKNTDFTQILSQTETLLQRIPKEERSGCISEIKNKLQEISSKGQNLANLSESSMIQALNEIATNCICNMNNHQTGSSELFEFPSDHEISILLHTSSEYLNTINNYETHLCNSSKTISGREDALNEALLVLKDVMNCHRDYTKANNELQTITHDILDAESRQNNLIIKSSNPTITELWDELSTTSEEIFTSRIAGIKETVDRLSRYPDMLFNIKRELQGKCDQIESNENRITQIINKINDLNKCIEEKEKEKSNYDGEVKRLTGGCGVEGMRNILEKNIKDADDRLQTAEREYNRSSGELKHNQDRINKIDKKISEISQTVKENRDKLSRHITEIASSCDNFTEDEIRSGLSIQFNDFNQAQEKVNNANTQYSNVRNSINEQNAVIRQIENDLKKYSESFSANDFVSSGEIKESLKDELDKDIKALDEQKSELLGQIRDNEKNLHDYNECDKNISSIQEKNKSLYDLMDMFDKKVSFANYAQTITFNYLISKSNYYIRRFTNNRYELKQTSSTQKTSDQEKDSFQIIVTDHHHGDLNRLINSLSGGEKFRVALGLSLGLSDLISKNIRVDNMFIDEGFDTLDDECLDSVISALSTITKRQIGLISHVNQIVNGSMIKSIIEVKHKQTDPSKSEVIINPTRSSNF